MIRFLRRQWLKPPSFHHPFRCITTTAVTSPSTTPKLIITPGSTHHNDLPTFLTYAERVNLSAKSTVYVGTHYEYTVATTLLRLGFSLIRTGRRADNGIDLLGYWAIPTLPEPLPVLIQCKAQKSVGPNYVRELEGAFAGVPVEWRRRDVLGLLATTQKATRGVLEMMGMNRWPMGFLKITKKGVVEQFDEDPAKRKRRKVRKEKVAIRKDIQLTWLGKPIFADRDSLDEKTVQLGEEISSADEEPDAEEKLVKMKDEGEKKRQKPGPKKDSEATTSRTKRSPKKAPVEEIKAKPATKKVGRPKKIVDEKASVKARTKKGITPEKTIRMKAPVKTRAKRSAVPEKVPKRRAKNATASENKTEKKAAVKPRTKKGDAAKETAGDMAPHRTKTKKGAVSEEKAT
ncbi:uncharacterized protein BDZ99DRAFT_374127 [Mytilinidion resinicola]|uniref:Required for respiratory growth protein 7, mitochondrial n=1 Tax=Mytilinidion resinicola TaxID=574789 RepID=A0A6A6Z8X2_9PEZI|nr:uncharacterized protein BDZ99DRAFT_374127 [Mytilinidion resinicola]KAF2817159.1 hypothetical protein BDZ99DRAFT_374127 [Mytilinidion resinicola]